MLIFPSLPIHYNILHQKIYCEHALWGFTFSNEQPYVGTVIAMWCWRVMNDVCQTGTPAHLHTCTHSPSATEKQRRGSNSFENK